jgi:hypothetical protein
MCSIIITAVMLLDPRKSSFCLEGGSLINTNNTNTIFYQPIQQYEYNMEKHIKIQKGQGELSICI